MVEVESIQKGRLDDGLRTRSSFGMAECGVSVFPVVPPHGATQVEVRQLKTPVGWI